MMKKLQICAALVLILFSCDEEVDPVEVPKETKEPGCFLTSYEEIYPEYNLTYTLNFMYNEQEEIVELKELEDYEGEFYSYRLLLKYENALISSIEYVSEESNVSYEIDIKYKDDLIEELTYHTLYDDQVDIDQYKFLYNEDQIVRMENWDNYSGDVPGELTLYTYEIYEYEEGNVVKKLVYNEHVGSGEEIVYTYKYDDYVNPFHEHVPFFIWSNNGIRFLSKNNVREVEYEDGTVLDSYDYTYNEFQLPEQITYVGLGTEAYLTYDCE